MNEELLKKLTKLLNSYRILYPEKKQRIFCRYLTRKAQKKLLFYLNPHKKGVIFGIGHHGTKILETIPTIQMLSYENKTCMTKFLLKKDSDIKDMGIKFLIETCINITGKTFYNYEEFSRDKLNRQLNKRNEILLDDSVMLKPAETLSSSVSEEIKDF